MWRRASPAAFLGQILSQVLAVTDDFAPWLTVLTGAFVAVLLIFLGRTSWSQLAEPSMQNTLEARCAKVTEARGLSPREAEVLVYLARGFTPACIAKSLVLSISTVRTHVRNIYRKLGINKREELLHLIDEE